MVKVIGHLLKNQQSPEKMLAQLTSSQGIMMSPEEAFSTLIEIGLSKSGYLAIRRDNPARYPPYEVIGAVKKICAPSTEFIEQTASKIRIKLKALLQHTTERIIRIIEGELTEYLDLNDLGRIDLVLLSSWGMEGSTGYSQYHQVLQDGCQEDSDVFSSTLTPIQMYLCNDRKHIMWFNPMPQSMRFCRRFILQFINESKEIILATKNDIEKEMSE